MFNFSSAEGRKAKKRRGSQPENGREFQRGRQKSEKAQGFTARERKRIPARKAEKRKSAGVRSQRTEENSSAEGRKAKKRRDLQLEKGGRLLRGNIKRQFAQEH